MSKDAEQELNKGNNPMEEQSKIEEQDNTAENNIDDNENENDNLTDWENQYNELNNTYLRLNAEFDNYRKRTIKEKSDMLKSGSERVLVDVISLVDDFERALDHMDKSEDIEALQAGIDLIHTKFTSFLIKHKVREIETIGLPFDTDKHEALTTIPSEQDEDKDKIVDCVQKGYTLDDKVIRYAKVIVAK